MSESPPTLRDMIQKGFSNLKLWPEGPSVATLGRDGGIGLGAATTAILFSYLAPISNTSAALSAIATIIFPIFLYKRIRLVSIPRFGPRPSTLTASLALASFVLGGYWAKSPHTDSWWTFTTGTAATILLLTISALTLATLSFAIRKKALPGAISLIPMAWLSAHAATAYHGLLRQTFQDGFGQAEPLNGISDRSIFTEVFLRSENAVLAFGLLLLTCLGVSAWWVRGGSMNVMPIVFMCEFFLTGTVMLLTPLTTAGLLGQDLRAGVISEAPGLAQCAWVAKNESTPTSTYEFPTSSNTPWKGPYIVVGNPESGALFIPISPSGRAQPTRAFFSATPLDLRMTDKCGGSR